MSHSACFVQIPLVQYIPPWCILFQGYTAGGNLNHSIQELLAVLRTPPQQLRPKEFAISSTPPSPLRQVTTATISLFPLQEYSLLSYLQKSCDLRQVFPASLNFTNISARILRTVSLPQSLCRCSAQVAPISEVLLHTQPESPSFSFWPSRLS